MRDIAVSITMILLAIGQPSGSLPLRGPSLIRITGGGSRVAPERDLSYASDAEPRREAPPIGVVVMRR